MPVNKSQFQNPEDRFQKKPKLNINLEKGNIVLARDMQIIKIARELNNKANISIYKELPRETQDLIFDTLTQHQQDTEENIQDINELIVALNPKHHPKLISSSSSIKSQAKIDPDLELELKSLKQNLEQKEDNTLTEAAAYADIRNPSSINKFQELPELEREFLVTTVAEEIKEILTNKADSNEDLKRAITLLKVHETLKKNNPEKTQNPTQTRETAKQLVRTPEPETQEKIDTKLNTEKPKKEKTLGQKLALPIIGVASALGLGGFALSTEAGQEFLDNKVNFQPLENWIVENHKPDPNLKVIAQGPGYTNHQGKTREELEKIVLNSYEHLVTPEDMKTNQRVQDLVPMDQFDDKKESRITELKFYNLKPDSFQDRTRAKDITNAILGTPENLENPNNITLRNFVLNDKEGYTLKTEVNAYSNNERNIGMQMLKAQETGKGEVINWTLGDADWAGIIINHYELYNTETKSVRQLDIDKDGIIFNLISAGDQYLEKETEYGVGNNYISLPDTIKLQELSPNEFPQKGQDYTGPQRPDYTKHILRKRP